MTSNKSRPWAQRLQCLYELRWTGYRSCCPLTRGPDDLFCTFHGLVDPHWGIRQGLPVHMRGRYSLEAPSFSGDGRIIFSSRAGKIYKIFWLDPTPATEVLNSLKGDVVTLKGINHNGDRLVFTGSTMASTISEYVGAWNVYIMNTRTGAAKKLWNEDHVPKPGWDLLSVAFWNNSLILFL